MADTTKTMESAVDAGVEREGKYLTFTLADEEYGIGILKIREIIGMMPITSVPQTPPFVKGVINLRGKVIPVVDLRLRFGMAEIDYTERTCIIVVEITGFEGKIQTYKKHDPSGGLGCFTPDSFPVFDVFRENVYVVADSNHGYKMLGVGKLVAGEIAGDESALLEQAVVHFVLLRPRSEEPVKKTVEGNGREPVARAVGSGPEHVRKPSCKSDPCGDEIALQRILQAQHRRE